VPRGRDFPRRNRLVSGLALGTVVVEAARKSGSLITARFANEQGRQVFAVPGSPLDPRAEGGNHLIREGAILCAETAHVVDVLAPMLRQGDLFGPVPFLAREGGEPPARQEALWDELDLPEVLPAPKLELESGFPQRRDVIADVPHRRLLDLIGSAPIAMDDLVRASGRPAREVSRILLELELEGVVQRHAGGALSRSG
jgi:DNA processing protein